MRLLILLQPIVGSGLCISIWLDNMDYVEFMKNRNGGTDYYSWLISVYKRNFFFNEPVENRIIANKHMEKFCV